MEYNSNPKNQTKGIWIPEEIKVDKKLDWPNKVLLSEIYSLCNLPDGCTASDNHFGKLLGIGRTSVNKRVNKLEKLGYITTKNHYKGKRCIGRTITKGSSKKNHTLVPTVSNSSSEDVELVVPEVQVDSSVENTINTITNTDILIQKLLQYTGATDQNPVEGLDIKGQTYLNRIEELFQLDPDTSTNKALYNYYDSLAGLVLQFGDEFISNGDLLKSNKELYELYGFENFREIRQDLNYVRDNMDYFLRLKTFE